MHCAVAGLVDPANWNNAQQSTESCSGYSCLVYANVAKPLVAAVLGGIVWLRLPYVELVSHELSDVRRLLWAATVLTMLAMLIPTSLIARVLSVSPNKAD